MWWRFAGSCRFVFNLRPSVWRRFLVEKSSERRYLCSLASVRRVASESWTAWKACGTGWAQLDLGALGDLARASCPSCP